MEQFHNEIFNALNLLTWKGFQIICTPHMYCSCLEAICLLHPWTSKGASSSLHRCIVGEQLLDAHLELYLFCHICKIQMQERACVCACLRVCVRVCVRCVSKEMWLGTLFKKSIKDHFKLCKKDNVSINCQKSNQAGTNFTATVYCQRQIYCWLSIEIKHPKKNNKAAIKL